LVCAAAGMANINPQTAKLMARHLKSFMLILS
jgi:hypothetical protein